MYETVAFQLGPYSFRFLSANSELSEQLAAFLPLAGPGSGCSVELEPLEVPNGSPTQAIDLANAQIHQVNCGKLYVDAAVVLHPSGVPILIAGPSKAGKTTLTLALCHQGDWKIVSEDLSFFAPETGTITSVPLPLSIRPGTAEMLEAQLGNPVSVFAKEWVYNPTSYYYSDLNRLPSLSVLLDPVGNSPAIISIEYFEAAKMVRALLPLSNALRIPDGVAILDTLIGSGQCARISGGSIKERVATIHELCSSVNSHEA